MRKVDQKMYPRGSRKKPAMKRPTYTDIIFHRRNCPRTRYYLTSGHEHKGEARDVNKEQSPFVFPPCSLMFAYFQYWKAWRRSSILQRRRADYQEQHTYVTMQRRDVLQRLRIDVAAEAEEAQKHKELNKAIAMSDLDPNYFTELAGRVVKEKFTVQRYIEDTRQVFKTRLLAGQQMDDCIRIEQQFDEEEKRLDRIKRQYRKYVAGFEEFLSKDHGRSMEMLERAEAEVRLTSEITERRNRLSKEFGQVRLDVYGWEESWRMVKMCQKFLYLVSPNFWRMEHDWLHRISTGGENILSASTDNLFGRYKMAEQVASLHNLIELFEEDVQNASPTKLYFEDPFDLIRVFKSLETQNLNALIHLESLAEPMSEMATTITTAESQIKSEVNEFIETIEELEDSIRKTEKRAADLEGYANQLLQEVFHRLVSSPEVLCLRIFIEDAYESCVGPNDANLDSFSMMKWIEKVHEELNLQLDTLPREVVRACEKEGFKQEMKAMRETEDAAKKFELMHRLLDALKRVMEPPGTKGRPLIWRSPPILEKEKRSMATPEPTDEEMQYLTFFTTYCKLDNFAAYRSQFPDDFDFTFEPRRSLTSAEQVEFPDTESSQTDSVTTATPLPAENELHFANESVAP